MLRIGQNITFYMEKSNVTNRLEEQIESKTHHILERKVSGRANSTFGR